VIGNGICRGWDVIPVAGLMVRITPGSGFINGWYSVHLFSIIVPSSVTYIDYYAFDGVGTYAPGYANVYFSGNAPAVDPDAFLGFNGTIYYHSAYAYDPAHNPSGFTTPTWQGHATATW